MSERATTPSATPGDGVVARTLAMDLLADGLCTASCLLAMESLVEHCACRCAGRWHAALLWAPADEWVGPSLYDTDELVELRARRAS